MILRCVFTRGLKMQNIPEILFVRVMFSLNHLSVSNEAVVYCRLSAAGAHVLFGLAVVV